MDLKSPAVAAEQRAWNYWFEDGLPTLVGGCGWLLFGLSFVFDHSVFRLVLVALYGAILLRHRVIIEWLKIRLTYPRTGYVTPPASTQEAPPPVAGLEALSLKADPARLAQMAIDQENRKRRMIPVLVMGMAAVFGTMFVESSWIYAVAGVALGLALWMMNGKDFQLSWIAIGGIPLIGFAMAIFPPDGLTPAHRLGYSSVPGGLLIVADGAVALVQYLRRNPVARVVAE